MGGKWKSFSGGTGPKGQRGKKTLEREGWRSWGEKALGGKGGKGSSAGKGGKDLREAKGDELREKDLGRKGGGKIFGRKREKN